MGAVIPSPEGRWQRQPRLEPVPARNRPRSPGGASPA